MPALTPRAAALLNYPRPEFTSPAAGASVTTTEPLVWRSVARTTATHFNVQTDTDSAFSAPTNYRSDRGGFEYYDGSAWVTLPYTGLPSGSSGNNVRLSTTLPTAAPLYARVRQSIMPTVLGGVLTSDSTYYYRTFKTSGTFSVQGAPLACDYLVIGGGGAGGQYYAGGGGGAGGVLYASTVFNPGNYAAVVGAGAPQNTTDLAPGANGSNSSLGAFVATGGGGGLGYYGGTGKDGGSGGGGGGPDYNNQTTTAGGNGVTGQGYAGGSSYTGYSGGVNVKPGYANAGGGGGAGGAGGNGAGSGTTTGAQGAGGAGITLTDWATATSTGVSGVYAGGGGGGGWGYSNSASWTATGGTATGGGGAGGLGNSGVAGTAGTANTGGGGGGASGRSLSGKHGGAGGSGLVIVRYLRTAVGG